MSIAQYLFCFPVPLTILFAAVLSVATGAGGCWKIIYARAVLVEVSLWKLSSNPPSSASVADTIKFLMMLQYTCTGPFSRSIYWIGVLDFGSRKNILRLCLVPPVLICRMHQSICGESFRFFCMLLLHLYGLHFNLVNAWFVLQFQFSDLSAPSLGSLGPSTLWGLWL